MKNFTLNKTTFLVFLLALAIQATPAFAQDIREASKKAEADRALSRDEAQKAEEAIYNDRSRMLAEVEALEEEQAALEAELENMAARMVRNRKLSEELQEQWSVQELGFREISGNVRISARELESLLKGAPYYAAHEDPQDKILPLLDKGYFPDIDDIVTMAGVFLEEMSRSGQVRLRDGEYVGRDGIETTGQIFQLGKFTAIYRSTSEIGFLAFNPESRRFFALSELPARSMAGSMEKYLSGESDQVPVDLSGGSALRQVSHQTSLLEQIQAGGPIVWPIFIIAIAAIIIILYKFIYLQRFHGDTDRFMGEVNTLAAEGDWKACNEIVDRHKGRKWPVIRVIRAGLEARQESRETLESTLQEAILREMPQVTRSIAVLAVLGAIAPLLGLLGTVTGMIETFRVITLFGTGDPKLMSGGISEALVTTELGLAVAIPIMLFHTLLSRRADHLIGEMEEKAVALTNIIEKQKLSS
jgi:biopolymer transport protein ExbB